MPRHTPTLEKIRKEFEKKGMRLHPPTWKDRIYQFIKKVIK